MDNMDRDNNWWFKFIMVVMPLTHFLAGWYHDSFLVGLQIFGVSALFFVITFGQVIK